MESFLQRDRLQWTTTRETTGRQRACGQQFCEQNRHVGKEPQKVNIESLGLAGGGHLDDVRDPQWLS